MCYTYYYYFTLLKQQLKCPPSVMGNLRHAHQLLLFVNWKYKRDSRWTKGRLRANVRPRIVHEKRSSWKCFFWLGQSRWPSLWATYSSCYSGTRIRKRTLRSNASFLKVYWSIHKSNSVLRISLGWLLYRELNAASDLVGIVLSFRAVASTRQEEADASSRSDIRGYKTV